MPIEITVQAFKGQPATSIQRLAIDELGAKVGRSPSCALCLEDPGRTISREQFEIVCRGASYFLVDKGSNPTQINGRPLGQGASVELRLGDKISIGDYEIAVSTPAETNPLAGLDLFGGTTAIDRTNSSKIAPPSDSSPFKSLGLEDWDILSSNDTRNSVVFDRPSGLDGPPGASDPLGLGTNQFSDLSSQADEPQIDDLFGLGQSSEQSQTDPTSHTNSHLFNPAKVDDFDDLFSDLAATPQTTKSDSFDFDDHAIPTVHEPMPVLRKAEPPTALTTNIPVAAENRGFGNSQELWNSFERGLGFSVGAGVTPQQAELCGMMLRNCLEGTQRLLQARAAFKRELRAEMTVIMARENNPLKLSPSVEGALSLMLSENSNGYKAAGPATEETFEDLLSHQTGLVFGLKAAMEALLNQFKPDQLEAQFNQKSLLNNILPGARKARAWEVFCDTYESISQEAADNFQKAFGEAFLKAYEQQMNDLHRARNR